MKKFFKVVAISLASVFGLVLVLAGGLAVKVWYDGRAQAEDQAAMVKTDEELIGRQFDVPRAGAEPVDVNLYLPGHEDDSKLPVVFNIHGGAFIAGDADALDTQSSRISRAWGVIVVTVNYTLAKDGFSIEDGTEDVVDTVMYVHNHADEFGADEDRFIMLGYSAGGYHATAATLKLKEQGVDVSAQVLAYPFIRDALDLYDSLDASTRASVAPALFVLADDDPISSGSLKYRDALAANGVETAEELFPGSIHGFIEENNPEYANLRNQKSRSPEQEVLARDAEASIMSWLSGVVPF